MTAIMITSLLTGKKLIISLVTSRVHDYRNMLNPYIINLSNAAKTKI